jgi:hypothetical protein
MNIRTLSSTTLVSLGVLAGVLLSWSAPAQAAVVHEYLGQIAGEVPAEGPHGESIPAPGPLGEMTGMTIDSGHLWVVEGQVYNPDVFEGREESRDDEFNESSGAFESQLELQEPRGYGANVAVGEATGEREVYVGGLVFIENAGNIPGVAVFGPSGKLQATWNGVDTPGGSLGLIDGVAVDNDQAGLGDWAAGDVYVASSNQTVDVFKPGAEGKEEYVTQITGTPTEPFNFSSESRSIVAVDELNGEVFIADGHVVDVFKPTILNGYEFVRQIVGPGGGFAGEIKGVAVDGGSGDAYVWEEFNAVVDEFSSEGVYLGDLTGTGSGPAGQFEQVRSVAVDQVSGDVYVGAEKVESKISVSRVDVFGPNVVVPNVVSEPASSVKVYSATLNGAVNSEGAGEAACQFDWGTSPSFGKVAPCPAHIAEGKSLVGVHVNIEGLLPDTTYYYRLQATSLKNGKTNAGEAFQNQQFTTRGPGLEESASDVASTSATLNATIDPRRSPTSYYFQYGTSSSYGTDVPAPPGVALGSGEANVEVGPHHLQGLVAGTVYHYRVVAISEVEVEPGVFERVEDDGPDQTFETQVAGGFVLPDGRAWEMVSPPEKEGALIETNLEDLHQAAASGDAVTYATNVPTELGVSGYANLAQVLSTRGPDGWVTRDLSLPHATKAIGQTVGYGQEYRFFSEDLSHAVVQPFGAFVPSLSPEASEQTAFLRTDFPNGDVSETCPTPAQSEAHASCYRPLVTAKAPFADVPEGTHFGAEGRCPPELICGPQFVGASPDASHVVLNYDGLSEWAAGKLTLFGKSGGLGNSDGEDARDAISRDGSRVFFTEGGTIYMHDMAKEENVTIAEGVNGEEGFQMASSDGSRVFFTQAEDLYECEIVEGVGGKLECKRSELASEVGGETVLGVSEEGCDVSSGMECDVYFAKGDSLYAIRNGVTSLIGAVSSEDAHYDARSFYLERRTSRVSPDGRWLAFMSERPLTGYDNDDAVSGRPDEEVYLYDAQTGKLACASCDPDGARPVGIEHGSGENFTVVNEGGYAFESSVWFSAYLPAWTQYELSLSRYQPRYLSDSGRLFFDSHDALVPQDVNGTWDVYEYEPEGVGSEAARCGPGSASGSVVFKAVQSFEVEGRKGEEGAGCVGLISSGSSAQESGFVDASESGGDVFFMTTSQLAPQDFDKSYDIYDAHECTRVSPCIAPPPVAPAECTTADACRVAPTPQPTVFGSPSSETFSGVGNLTPAAPVAKPKAKPLTRAQKLAAALKACRKDRAKRRASCERTARRRYGAKTRRASDDRRAG